MHGDQDSLIGTTLGDRYVVEMQVGEGGMGAVYAARQLGLDRTVAIKVLLPDLAVGAVEAERFRREALATARIVHPNIVKVFDFGQLPDGSAYLVMEFLDGPSFERWLAATRSPDPAAVVAILEPVCDAVDALHAAGIVHRDIKPANVSIPSSSDPHGVVKLIDLGISRFADTRQGDLTGKMIIGTAEYIAPEVATGGVAGPASDRYALGVMAFEALTGSVPFTGQTDRELLGKHISSPPPLASRMRRGLPRTFDPVFQRALAKDPSERFGSGRDLAAALRKALSAPGGGDEPACRAGRKALLVESDDGNRAFLKSCLMSVGFETVEAADAVDALLRLGAATFDVVVVNSALAGLDGVSLLKLKTDKGIATPAVLLTGDGEIPGGVARASHGVAAVVALPVDVSRFMTALFEALR